MSRAYKTTAAYVSGAICGRMWWPDAMAGTPFQGNIRQQLDRFSDSSGATFRDVLLHMLMEHGGDFQNARFAADTVIRVERVSRNGPYKSVHVREREISSLPDCEDLVHADTFTGDFIND